MQNLSYENEFDLHENETVGRTHLHMNGFALRLILTQTQKETKLTKKGEFRNGLLNTVLCEGLQCV